MENNYSFDEFFEDGSDEETELFIQHLVDNGAAEWDGVDKFGERMYKFNMPILQKVMPELYNEIMIDLDEAMLELYKQDLVEIEYNEDLEATFSISEKARVMLYELGMGYLFDSDPD